jgi:hypothetical protein
MVGSIEGGCDGECADNPAQSLRRGGGDRSRDSGGGEGVRLGLLPEMRASVEILAVNLARAAEVNRRFDRYFVKLWKFTSLRWHRGAYRDVRALK